MSSCNSNPKANSKDPAWKYSFWPAVSDKNKIQCELCGAITNVGIYRQKQHLIGGYGNVKKCPKTSTEIIKELSDHMTSNKRIQNDLLDDPFSQDPWEINVEESEDVEVECCAEKRKRTGKEKSTQVSQVTKKKPRERGPMDGFLRRNPEEVIAERAKGNAVQTTINNRYKKEDRKKVNQYVARWFYQAGITFNTVKLRSFQVMVEAIGQFGPGYRPPSFHELREPLLKIEVDRTKDLFQIYQTAWKKYGCTIMSDGWTDKRTRSLINFLVNCPEGTYFLKSIDASSKVHDAQYLFEVLDNVIEEVGEEHVVQVVTDNHAAYVAAGRKLMDRRKQLFWTPCAAHCLDLILEDIGNLKGTKAIIAKARSVTYFIYKHPLLLNQMRTKIGKDLVRTAVTRFATAFLNLQSLFTHKQGLRALFVSSEWNNSKWAKKIEGKRVANIVLSTTFWRGISYCLKASYPLVQVLRLVDGDEKPPMGYVYAAMEQARDQIQSFFGHKERDYKPVLTIVDKRWEEQLNQPLHVAGFFLNPSLYFKAKDISDDSVGKFEVGFLDCLERMVRDEELQDKISRQMDTYKNCRDLFGKDMAIRQREKKQPIEWWDTYGANTPELRRLALRILGLTCTSSGCERNWSTFEFIHTKKRNRLEQKRLNDLVFVQYNQRLRERFLTRKENPKAYDPICFDDIDDSSEWLIGKEPSEDIVHEGLSWLDVDIAVGASEGIDGPSRPQRNMSSATSSSTPRSSSRHFEGEEENEEPQWTDSDETEGEEENTYLESDDNEDGDEANHNRGLVGDGIAGGLLQETNMDFTLDDGI